MAGGTSARIMGKAALQDVLQHLSKVAAVQTHRGLSDRQLLDEFVASHDEAAFTVLIERHGPMVLGVCRRALPNAHDAEDACQASFLVLARKAASIRKRTSVGSWLHGVASRVALKLKRGHARRQRRERRVAVAMAIDPAAELSWREVQGILDEEVQQLPDRYRAAVIHCYLEGLTRDEAARRLCLSPGSLHGRLERARALLRDRLANRGLTLGAVLSAAALGENVVQAALPPLFVVTSTRAALQLAAGQPVAQSVVASHVLALTQEVVKTMFLTKVKLGTAVALCVGLFVTVIAGSFTSPSAAQDKPRGPLVERFLATGTAESDTEFIRRISKDLRGTEPTPAEIHFFVASTDPGRRQKLIDLFIQERQAKQKAIGRKSDPKAGAGAAIIGSDPLAELRMRERVAQQLMDLGQLRVIPDVSGVIDRIDPKNPSLVAISLGSDQGLAKDHTLDVFRLRPAPRYLGKIILVEVLPQKAVGRRIDASENAPPLKTGDVVSSLVAPAKK